MKARPKPGTPDDKDADPAAAAPPRERRGTHRVADDQKSGQGSMSALSKLKMIERKRASLRPDPESE